MATGSHEFDDKICDTCAPKKTVAITSCHGCHRHFCRKHFNEHRDQLSNYLNKHADLHDEIREDLKTRIDRTSEEQLANDDAKRLLQHIDDWVEKMIDECRRAADEVRASVKQLFDKTTENDSLTQRLSSLAKEIEEQQQSENFVERDLDRWMKQLNELKIEINRPTEFPTDVTIETQDIDWRKCIKIAGRFDSCRTREHYVVVGGEKGTGKTTFIHYVANFFANKHSFHDRLPQTAIYLNKKETIINSLISEEKYMVDQYSFSTGNQTSLVFLDCVKNITGSNHDDFLASLIDFFQIDDLAALVVLDDGVDPKLGLHTNDLLTNDLLQLSEGLRRRDCQWKHAFSVFTNCPPSLLSLDYSTLNIYDNLSVYFMQNSAYQLSIAPSLTDSVAADFCASMKTIEQIMKKIVQGIHQQT